MQDTQARGERFLTDSMYASFLVSGLVQYIFLTDAEGSWSERAWLIAVVLILSRESKKEKKESSYGVDSKKGKSIDRVDKGLIASTRARGFVLWKTKTSKREQKEWLIAASRNRTYTLLKSNQELLCQSAGLGLLPSVALTCVRKFERPQTICSTFVATVKRLGDNACVCKVI